MTNFLKGWLYMVAMRVSLATIEVVGVLLMTLSVSPITLLSFRFWIATILLTGFMIVIGKSAELRVSRANLPAVIGQGLIMAVHTLFYWYGIKALANIPLTLILYHTWPLWVLAFSAIFLKEKLGKIDIAIAGLGILGSMIAMKSTSSFVVNPVGCLLIFGAAITMAMLMISARRLSKRIPAMTTLFYSFLTSSVVMALIQNPGISFSSVPASGWGYIFFLGFVSTFLVYVFMYQGLRYLKASDAGLSSYIRIAVALVLAFVVLHQAITLNQAIGAILVISSTVLLFKKNKQ